MTTGVLATPPILQFTFDNGEPAAGGSILTQIGGVNAATYADVALTVPLPNPIPLNSRGEISDANGNSQQLFLIPNQVYTFTLFDSNGNQVWVGSYVNGVQASAPSAAQIANILYPVLNTEVGVTNQLFPYYNVLRYGADPTGVASSLSAFNRAYTSATAVLPHGAIYIPAGTYLIPLPGLNWTNQTDIRVYGDGPEQSLLKGDTTNAYTILTVSADTGAGTTGLNLNLSNFGIKNGASSGQHGLKVADYLYGTIENMLLQSSGNTLTLAGMANITCKNLNVLTWNSNVAGNAGLTLTRDTLGIGCGPLVFDGCQFEGQSNVTFGGAINSQGTFSTVFNACSIIALGPSLVTVAEFADQDDVTLVDCYSESSCNTTNNNAFMFRLGATNAPKNFTLIGGRWFNGNGSFNCKYAIFGAKVQNLTVIGPIFANFATAAITYGFSVPTAITVINTAAEGGAALVFDPGIVGAPTGGKVQFYTAPALFSGYGTTINALFTTNFPGTAATLPQCGGMISILINVLKGIGVLGT